MVLTKDIYKPCNPVTDASSVYWSTTTSATAHSVLPGGALLKIDKGDEPAEFGFARVTTPRAWLSTWSGLSSNAAVEVNGPRVTVPSLVLSYTGDNAIFPSDAQAAYAALGACDKQIVNAPGRPLRLRRRHPRSGAVRRSRWPRSSNGCASAFRRPPDEYRRSDGMPRAAPTPHDR